MEQDEHKNEFVFLNQVEVDKRNEQYTQLLKMYTENQKKMQDSRLWLKKIFFWMICSSFFFIIIVGGIILLRVSNKQQITYSDFGIALTGLGSILSVIIVLPKIIAEHLFPKDGERAESNFVTAMQEFDLASSFSGVIEGNEIEFDEDEDN